MNQRANGPTSQRLIVIVEDDPSIAEGLALNLKLQGYRTSIVSDGESAPEVITSTTPDLVLLDISLPKQSGLWVLEQLRQAGNEVPVVVLSARQDEYDKVAALQLGADDYVTKPFALAELLARVTAVLRRSGLRSQSTTATPTAARDAVAEAEPAEGEDERTLRFGDVVMDLAARTVTRAGAPVRLTHLEFELLSFLGRQPSQVFSREELFREVWGVGSAGSLRTVDNFVAQLRTKIEADPDEPKHLLTVRGSGYRFER